MPANLISQGVARRRRLLRVPTGKPAGLLIRLLLRTLADRGRPGTRQTCSFSRLPRFQSLAVLGVSDTLCTALRVATTLSLVASASPPARRQPARQPVTTKPASVSHWLQPVLNPVSKRDSRHFSQRTSPTHLWLSPAPAAMPLFPIPNTVALACS